MVPLSNKIGKFWSGVFQTYCKAGLSFGKFTARAAENQYEFITPKVSMWK